MKKDGKYRFSLQFSDKTEENRMVGELLERMGNRKSTLIVDAVREYLVHHPELQEGDCKIEICMTPVGMEERIARYQQKESTACQSGENLQAGESQQMELSDSMEKDISQMLDNLDFFQ